MCQPIKWAGLQVMLTQLSLPVIHLSLYLSLPWPTPKYWPHANNPVIGMIFGISKDFCCHFDITKSVIDGLQTSTLFQLFSQKHIFMTLTCMQAAGH